jgi:hypothetical protein
MEIKMDDEARKELLTIEKGMGELKGVVSTSLQYITDNLAGMNKHLGALNSGMVKHQEEIANIKLATALSEQKLADTKKSLVDYGKDNRKLILWIGGIGAGLLSAILVAILKSVGMG